MPAYVEVYRSRISSDNTQDQPEEAVPTLNLPGEPSIPDEITDNLGAALTSKTMRRQPDAEIVGNPGAALTPETMRRQADAAALIHLIGYLAQDGISWSADDAVKISTGTAKSALMFFQHLPTTSVLPKISPDGEGGLMAVWEKDGGPTLVIIDNFNIHLATGATTPEAQYFPEFVFDGEQIPDVVLKAITR
jgi:hypothetical protein